MDTIVYYDRPLTDLPPPGPAPEGETIRRAMPDDADEVAAVAAAAFWGYFGYYHADPRLDDEAADAAYVEWALRSVQETTETTPVLVAERSGRLGGFMTLHLSDDKTGEIVLNSVAPDAQGEGLYGRLVDRALMHLAAEGLSRATVSTQINNIPVQRAWGRRGFRMSRSLYTLHRWFG